MVELSAGASVALGVLVGLVSTSVQSIGLTLQRKSHILEEKKEECHKRRPAYRRRRWQLGMLMFIVANLVGSTIQITTLPLPVLSTLQASGLVFNSICASIILGEPFTRYSLAGTNLVAVGAVLIGTFGSVTEPSHNLDQLLSLLGRHQFLFWLFSTFFVALVVILLAWLVKRVCRRATARVRLARGMLFGCVSGILSAHSLLVAKSAVELIVRTIVDRHNEFNRWQSWMILLGLVSLALSQLYYLHRGLKLCSTSVLYPFVFCVYNIIAILDGLIYFDQSSRLPLLDALLIALGTVILLSGVLALSWRLDESPNTIDTATATAIAVPGSNEGRDARHRVPPPQTALGPGLGIMKGNADSGHDEGRTRAGGILSEEHDGTAEPLLAETLESELAPEHAFPGRKARRTKRGRTFEAGADEVTPLLSRSETAPKSDLASSRLLPTRRMTVAQEADELWDELNDRDVGLSDSTRSPMSSRKSWRRSTCGTDFPAPTRRRTLAAPPSQTQATWWGGYGAAASVFSSQDRRKGKGRMIPRRGEGGAGGSEAEETDSSPPRHAQPSSKQRQRIMLGSGDNQPPPLGEWLKLKWWKGRRWRDGDDQGDASGEQC